MIKMDSSLQYWIVDNVINNDDVEKIKNIYFNNDKPRKIKGNNIFNRENTISIDDELYLHHIVNKVCNILTETTNIEFISEKTLNVRFVHHKQHKNTFINDPPFTTKIHTDAASHHTVILYLTTVTKDGYTRMWTEIDDEIREQSAEKCMNMNYIDIMPKSGRIFVFDPRVLHAGKASSCEDKLIMQFNVKSKFHINNTNQSYLSVSDTLTNDNVTHFFYRMS